MFAGLRPLVKTNKDQQTASLSRDHFLFISSSGLLTIAGGKWTTYRKMAQDAVDQAALIAGLEKYPCPTEQLHVHGWQEDSDFLDPLHAYGSDTAELRQLMTINPLLAEKIHPDLPYFKASIIWAIRREMALTLEDVLSRRTRALLLDARAAIASAAGTARLMAAELGREKNWELQETETFTALARTYLME